MPFSNHGEAMIKRGKTVNRNAITLTIVALLALTGVSANASLLGDDVTLTSAPFPYDPSNPDSATVDGSVEFQGPEFSFLPGWTLDLASESIQLRLESDGSKSAFWKLVTGRTRLDRSRHRRHNSGDDYKRRCRAKWNFLRRTRHANKWQFYRNLLLSTRRCSRRAQFPTLQHSLERRWVFQPRYRQWRF